MQKLHRGKREHNERRQWAEIDTRRRIVDHFDMAEQELHTHWIRSSGRESGGGSSSALFPYWSFTKTAIAICALKLTETRALDLDTRLAGHKFCLRQLLAHTSGLPDYGSLKEYHSAVACQDKPWSREKLLDATLKQGLLFEPEEGWSYSNIGYLMVRETIEEVTAKPLGQVIAELICKPLGLDSVEFWDTHDQSFKLHWDAGACYDPRWVYHGCLIGTAQDAARLLHALVADNLLKPDSLNQIRNRRSLGGLIAGRPWATFGYALGLMSGAIEGVGSAIGHSGGGPFSTNAIYHFPDLPDPITIACFTDGTNEGIAEFEVARIAQS